MVGEAAERQNRPHHHHPRPTQLVLQMDVWQTQRKPTQKSHPRILRRKTRESHLHRYSQNRHRSHQRKVAKESSSTRNKAEIRPS